MITSHRNFREHFFIKKKNDSFDNELLILDQFKFEFELELQKLIYHTIVNDSIIIE